MCVKETKLEVTNTDGITIGMALDIVSVFFCETVTVAYFGSIGLERPIEGD